MGIKDGIKVSADSVVPVPLLIFREGDPEIAKFDPNKIIVIPKDAVDAVGYRTPYGSLVTITPEAGSLVGNEKDAPDLSDITVYTPLTRKERAATKDIYYEIVFKVRNSASTPADIIGVDARIVGTEPEND